MLIPETTPLFVTQEEPLPLEGLCLSMKFQACESSDRPGVGVSSLQHFSFYFSVLFHGSNQ